MTATEQCGCPPCHRAAHLDVVNTVHSVLRVPSHSHGTNTCSDGALPSEAACVLFSVQVHHSGV